MIIDNLLSFKSVDSIMEEQSFYYSQAGDFEMGGKFDIDIICRMDFARFPFDSQTCHFDMYIGKDYYVFLAKLLSN